MEGEVGRHAGADQRVGLPVLRLRQLVAITRTFAERTADSAQLHQTIAEQVARLFRKHGYIHQQLNGQKMHHGVAIVSRIALGEPGSHDWQDNGEARHVGVRLPGGGWSACRISQPGSGTLCRATKLHGFLDKNWLRPTVLAFAAVSGAVAILRSL